MVKCRKVAVPSVQHLSLLPNNNHLVRGHFHVAVPSVQHLSLLLIMKIKLEHERESRSA